MERRASFFGQQMISYPAAESGRVANVCYAKLGDALILTDDIVYAPGECRDWGE